MSFKSIEMQVALPRTFDAGKVADQHQLRHTIDQSHLAEHMQQMVRQQSQTVISKNGKDNVRLKEKQEKERYRNLKKQKKKALADGKNTHPYKGKLIDYNG
jgi:hypothetical protein